MTGLVFVDTNVFIYVRDPRDSVKQTRAREWIQFLWDDQRGRTSIQVLSEFYEVITRKFHATVPRDAAWDEMQSYLSWNPQPINTEVLIRAHEIQHRNLLSWWDCLVIAAAQIQGCVLLLSEDMQDGADYGGVIVRNPFVLRVADEHTAYAPIRKLPSRHRGRGRPRLKPRAASASSGS